ncbi:phage holin family protein [Algoriphagus sp.]|uniref:phage holin family protein n=1 Tax=Algoriphagus sp. TaxID=1872435 RepID=UPI00260A8CA4|nr:phage holin family protein [Algoriphagus sp.]
MLNVSEIVQTVKSLIETRVNLVKSEIQDEIMGMVSRIILLMAMVILVLLVFLFLSLSLAFFLSSVTESPFMGFLLVSLLYLLMLLILYLSRYNQGIQQKVQNGIKSFIFDKLKGQDSDEK